MKGVLLSVQPQWVEKILSGKKPIEIRKTAPKCELPVDVYIYCTKHTGNLNDYVVLHRETGGECDFWIGKIVAKFTLREVEEFLTYSKSDTPFNFYHEELYKKACLTGSQFYKYGKGKPIYAWHISDLQIFDKPVELGEFKVNCGENCDNCELWDVVDGGYECSPVYDCVASGLKPLSRPPQSWQYVEIAEVKENG